VGDTFSCPEVPLLPKCEQLFVVQSVGVESWISLAEECKVISKRGQWKGRRGETAPAATCGPRVLVKAFCICRIQWAINQKSSTCRQDCTIFEFEKLLIFRWRTSGWWRMDSDSDSDPEALFCGGNCTLAEAYRMRQVSVVHSGENGKPWRAE